MSIEPIIFKHPAFFIYYAILISIITYTLTKHSDIKTQTVFIIGQNNLSGKRKWFFNHFSKIIVCADFTGCLMVLWNFFQTAESMKIPEFAMLSVLAMATFFMMSCSYMLLVAHD